MTNKLYGTLQVIYTEVPYENEEEEKRAEEMNKEIAHLGFRTYRSALDWGYRLSDAFLKHADSREDPAFKTGDLVKVFKTIADGDLHWQGKIDYDRSEYHHGFQKGMDKGEWSRMFSYSLPAILKRDGKLIHGALDAFAETGTEGVIWSVHEYGKAGYEGLHCLQDGDELTVYTKVTNGDIEWEGELSFSEPGITKIADWREALRTTKHMDSKKWLQLSYDNRPMVITPKPKLN